MNPIISNDDNSIKTSRLNELKQAQLIQQSALLEYVAMMVDVELPSNNEPDEMGGNHEQMV